MCFYPVSIHSHMKIFCHVMCPIQRSKITIKIVPITTWKITTKQLHSYIDYYLETLTNLLKYYDANCNFVYVSCVMHIIHYHFHYETSIIKLESLKVDCCGAKSNESSSIRAAVLVLFISYKKCLPSFLVNQFLQELFATTKEPTSTYGFDFLFIFSWLLSVWAAVWMVVGWKVSIWYTTCLVSSGLILKWSQELPDLKLRTDAKALPPLCIIWC